MEDLHVAYIDARRHKRSKPYVKQFESHLNENLEALCDELFNRVYKPRPSSCFIITDPKRREVFAAEFRDRIVHHLYYNYTRELFERTFIHDTYSCIKGRGTHFGISRLEQHIRGTVGRMRAKLRLLAESDRSRWSASLTSFCGVLSHGANYRLRRRLMLAVPAFAKYGVFDMEYRRYFGL